MSNFVEELDRERKTLLDLTLRNRMINTPQGRGKTTRIDVVDGKSREVFDALVVQKKELSFLPGKEESNSGVCIEEDGLVQESGQATEDSQSPFEHQCEYCGCVQKLHTGEPVPDEIYECLECKELFEINLKNTEDENSSALEEVECDLRRTGCGLQTSLDVEILEKRLLKLSHDAKTITEEQGVNNLYLALGFLEWYDSAAADTSYFAPLVLVPVTVVREQINAEFQVRFFEEDIAVNMSLQRKLKEDFGIELPEIRGDTDSFDLCEYMNRVREVIASQARWIVHEDKITLWFFSFSKYRMFRDLDCEEWPDGAGPVGHEMIRILLGEDTTWEPPLFDEDSKLDDHLEPDKLCHVVDCDSSQAAAIEEVRRGRNLVIQGPPGTGKSQSITNIIAAAVRDKKTVLFVSEKMAALQVVKSRLDDIGLGDVCLELHSHKANRTAVLENLEQTLVSTRRETPGHITGDTMSRVQNQLSEYVEELHAPLQQYGLSPYQLIGKISRLHAKSISPLPFDVPDLNQLVYADFIEKKALLKSVIDESAQVSSDGRSIWFGVAKREHLLPSDVISIQQDLDASVDSLKSLLEAADELCESLALVGSENEYTFKQLNKLCTVAECLLVMPRLDSQAFSHQNWELKREDIECVLKHGVHAEAIHAELADVFLEEIWRTDFDTLLDSAAVLGVSVTRWCKREWWRVRKQLRRFAGRKFPWTVERQLNSLKKVQEWQQLAESLEAGQDLGVLGSSVFGSLWDGVHSNWSALQEIVAWESKCASLGLKDSFHQIVKKWEDKDRTRKAFFALKSALEVAEANVEKISALLLVDYKKAFGDEVLQTPLEAIRSKFKSWRASADSLGAWQCLQRRFRQLEEVGLGPLIIDLESGEIDHSADDRLELMYCESAVRHATEERKAFANFNGREQNERVDRFRELDLARLHNARAAVRAVHSKNISVDIGNLNEALGIVRAEIRRNRRRRTLRKLLADAGEAVQKIKPVFMMSPMSVAQYLTPGKTTFDLLVIDEASQVSPVLAFGAIARSKQVVVVGDNKQLPPTKFFDHVCTDDDQGDHDAQASDMESILDLCVVKNMPQRMLRWHYRSRHHSLIAVSNDSFYGNRLYVVPSAAREVSDQGLSLRFVENGVYERGGARWNLPEAKVVAEAMIQHAKDSPDKSLGVAAFSTAQRDAIISELELLRKANPETEPFFSSTKNDAWFIKNLENIQGDERDVIFISVGYGPDRDGFTSMNFGPVTRSGGERRLNVLISRAKYRCIVFSSIRADEIDLRNAESKGAKVLKKYLQFAETGRLEMNQTGGQDYDSEFEAQVADVLKEAGWTVESQVGIAGFRVDLAVVDPNCPGRYLLGIECDGAKYHQSRWARDRDRLRQQVLENVGWTIYRIWSTEWFHNCKHQIRALLAKLDDLAAVSRGNVAVEVNESDSELLENQSEKISCVVSTKEIDEQENRCDVSSFSHDIQQSEPTAKVTESENHVYFSEGNEFVTLNEEDSDIKGSDVFRGSVGSAYVEAEFHDPIMDDTELLDVRNKELAEIVYHVVRQESPIHRDEIVQRIRALWGYSRAGGPITRKVKQAIRSAKTKWNLTIDSGFVCLPDQTVFTPRSRESVQSNSLRDAERLPHMEIDRGITLILGHQGRVKKHALMSEVTRMFGFRQLGPRLKVVIEKRVETLLDDGRIVSGGGDLRLNA